MYISMMYPNIYKWSKFIPRNICILFLFTICSLPKIRIIEHLSYCKAYFTSYACENIIKNVFLYPTKKSYHYKNRTVIPDIVSDTKMSGVVARVHI